MARVDTAVATAASCLGAAVLASMDPTTLSVAGPAIAADLSTSISQTGWIVNAYLLALSVLLIASGSASGRFGELRMLRAGTLVFGLGAVAASFAPTGATLLVARALQGAGAAAMIPAGIGLYRGSFPPASQAVAMSVYAGFSTGAAALGPVVAGAVLEVGSWRAVFALIACAAFALVGVMTFAARAGAARASTAAPVDGLAMRTNVALGIGLSAIAWALVSSGERGWGDRAVAVALVVGIVFVSTTLLGLRRRARGSEVRGFAPDRISPYLTLVVVTSIPNLGVIFLLSTFLQRAQALSPLEVSVAVLPCLATTALLMPLAARWSARSAPYRQISLGLAMQCVALLLLTRVGADSSYAEIGPAFVLLGAGGAFVMPTLLNGLLGSASPSHAALMGGANLTANQFGGILGVAVFGSLIATGLGPRYDAALADAGVPPGGPTSSRVELLATQGPEQAAADVPAEQRLAAVAAGQHAYARSASVAISTAAGVAGVALLLALAFGSRLDLPRQPLPPRRARWPFARAGRRPRRAAAALPPLDSAIEGTA